MEVPFIYQHRPPVGGVEVKDFTIQTSEFRSLGLDIEFFIECDGEKKQGRVCPGVQNEQRVKFYAKVSLRDCQGGNDIAVSVGIYGYNTVSAIFVTPLCGCECENPRLQERRSPQCRYQGDVVCGTCSCDPGKGGPNCECDLAHYGVNSAAELLNQCIQ
ncbi:EGF-like domain containing protein [Aphelenchoides avenae]|nr:EGF-like domain containing protein [Aphelenchus avenae]